MQRSRSSRWRHLAIDETVILLHLPPPLVGVSIVMERERQQNDSLINGYFKVGLQLWRREVEPCRRTGSDRQCDVIVAMLNTASSDSGKWRGYPDGTVPYRLTTTAREVHASQSRF